MIPLKGHSISCQLELYSCKADWILVPTVQLQLKPITSYSSVQVHRCEAQPTSEMLWILKEADVPVPQVLVFCLFLI